MDTTSGNAGISALETSEWLQNLTREPPTAAELWDLALTGLRLSHRYHDLTLRTRALGILLWLRDLSDHDLAGDPTEFRKAALEILRMLKHKSEILKQRLATIQAIFSGSDSTSPIPIDLQAKAGPPPRERSVYLNDDGLPGDLRRALRNKRERLHHARKVAAGLCHVSLDTYRGWERDRRPSLSNRQAVKDYLAFDGKPREARNFGNGTAGGTAPVPLFHTSQSERDNTKLLL